MAHTDELQETISFLMKQREENAWDMKVAHSKEIASLEEISSMLTWVEVVELKAITTMDSEKAAQVEL